MPISLSWFFLIGTGLVAGLWGSATLPSGEAFGLWILVLTVWISFGKILAFARGVRRLANAHFGRRWPNGTVVTHVVRTTDRVDLQRTLDALNRDSNPRRRPIGVSFVGAGIIAVFERNRPPASIEWENYPRSLTETTACATNAIYLLRDHDDPYAVMVRPRDRASRKQIEIEVLALTPETTRRALDQIINRSRASSVYRGQAISLEKSEDKRESYAIKFHDLQAVDRDSIILAPEVLSLIERNILGPVRHGDRLRQLGQPVRRGLLLHGPPGTGKTLVTRYLAKACKDFTVILLTGRQLSLIRESCQLARMLAPAIIVLEDVDLVAGDRGRNRHTTVLHELMDEMDGLGTRAEITFLLTTNQPARLEKALTARPGRIDQSVYFPLPDAGQRSDLLKLFGRRTDLSAVDLPNWVDRTGGASPAFILELVRRVTLLTIDRGEEADPPRITDADFTAAMLELIEFGGDLTRDLLGFARRETH
jgi:cell division protease FtsH